MKANKLLFLFFTFVATVASAGAKFNSEVFVEKLPPPNWGQAKGSIAAARASADLNQYIWCRVGVNTSSGTPFRYLTCEARNAAGVTGYCSVTNPSQWMVDLVTSLRDTDILWFWWTQNDSVCREINVDRTSTVTH